MKKHKALLVSLLFFIGFSISPLITLAHPGNTDSSGCHTCRTNCPDWGLSYGEYHCHNAKSSYQPQDPIKSTYGSNGTGYTEYWPSYEYSAPSIPSCPLNSSYSYSEKSCECNYGYLAQGGKCVSGNSICWNEHGYSSRYDSLTQSCECEYGYAFNDYGQCASRNDICEDLHGYNSEYDILSNSCQCESGYVADQSKTSCMDADYFCYDTYGYNSNYDPLSQSCRCDDGYALEEGLCLKIAEQIQAAEPIRVQEVRFEANNTEQESLDQTEDIQAPEPKAIDQSKESASALKTDTSVKNQINKPAFLDAIFSFFVNLFVGK